MPQERKMTLYFREQVLRKRPYLRMEWCLDVIANPVASEVQQDGRIRFWGSFRSSTRSLCELLPLRMK